MEEVFVKEKLPQPQIEIRRERSLEFVARSITNYKNVGDEEAVFMLALTLDHPEWRNYILEQIRKYKPHVQNIEEILERLNKDYVISGWQSKIQLKSEDVEWWTEHLLEVETRIVNLLAYFRPSSNEVVSRIVIVPSDELLSSKDTGSSFRIADIVVIMSHTENIDNFEHEFLHTIINPLTEEFSELIPQEKIIALASNKLKNEEMYGDHALSLLNEELIRTYIYFIKAKTPILSFMDFEKLINSMDEEKFNEITKKGLGVMKNLKTLGILTLKDLKFKAKEYYEKYEANKLREVVYQLYQRFNTEKATNPKVKFKDFFLREIKELKLD